VSLRKLRRKILRNLNYETVKSKIPKKHRAEAMRQLQQSTKGFSPDKPRS